eukprot:TRINITY_DN2618_c4_g1_i2.p1 TRINITY_DN2618_c4_g1~~TRINITY_DN2618_c4_g1_i2.p1  ORF type:complete len:442 (-),score=128.52 TRINITY_DN2618_c4_g1_i2:37-1362(-)
MNASAPVFVSSKTPSSHSGPGIGRGSVRSGDHTKTQNHPNSRNWRPKDSHTRQPFPPLSNQSEAEPEPLHSQPWHNSSQQFSYKPKDQRKDSQSHPHPPKRGPDQSHHHNRNRPAPSSSEEAPHQPRDLRHPSSHSHRSSHEVGSVPSQQPPLNEFFGTEEQQPLLVTLKIDDQTQHLMDGLRKQYFPSHRNFIPAHVTLFHALPPSKSSDIESHLKDLARIVPTFQLDATYPILLGNGVGIHMDGEAVQRIRLILATKWKKFLSPQDAQGFRAHVTIQNKVDSGEAEKLFAHMKSTWNGQTGKATGFQLWKYLGGPWEHIRDYDFQGTNYFKLNEITDGNEGMQREICKRNRKAYNKKVARERAQNSQVENQVEKPVDFKLKFQQPEEESPNDGSTLKEYRPKRRQRFPRRTPGNSGRNQVENHDHVDLSGFDDMMDSKK